MVKTGYQLTSINNRSAAGCGLLPGFGVSPKIPFYLVGHMLTVRLMLECHIMSIDTMPYGE